MDDIHKRISRVREHFNLTQDEFGKRIGITRSSISGLESGRRDPSEQTISFICKEFGVNKSWLMNGGSDNNMLKMTPNERVRVVREDLNLTVRDFAKKLGVQGSAISLIENDKRALSNQMIHSICCEYNINEEWLRFGNGKMKRSPDEFSLDEYARAKGATDEDIFLVKAYFSIDPEIRKTFLEQLQQAKNM